MMESSGHTSTQIVEQRNPMMASDQEPFLPFKEESQQSQDTRNGRFNPSASRHLGVKRLWRNPFLVHVVLIAVYTAISFATIRTQGKTPRLPLCKQRHR